MNRLTGQHLEAMFWILQYLKKNPGRGVFFKKSMEKDMVVFTDADWIGSLID